MPAGDQLLAAVVASADDDAPRRVYADWLGKRGRDRARGELIHVQCDLAAIDPDTDDPGTRDRMWDLRKRAKALWGAHWHRWQQEADLGNPYTIEFERGFPVACKLETAAHWPRILASTVRRVRVAPSVALAAPAPLAIHSVELETGYEGDGKDDERRPAVLARIATSGVFPALRNLVVGTTCTATPARAFGAAWNGTLTRFQAHVNRQGVVALFGEGRLGGLRELAIYGTSQAELAAGLTEARVPAGLRSLSLLIDEGALRNLTRWKNPPRLDRLSTSLSSESLARAVIELPLCARLRDLGICLRLADPGVRDLLGSGRLASLRSVRLDACGLTKIDLSPFPDVRDLWLDLDEPEDLTRLASPTLRKLRLFNEWHIPRVLEQLAQARLPALEEVSNMARYPEDHSDEIPREVLRAMPRLRRAISD